MMFLEENVTEVIKIIWEVLDHSIVIVEPSMLVDLVATKIWRSVCGKSLENSAKLRYVNKFDLFSSWITDKVKNLLRPIIIIIIIIIIILNL